MRRAILEALVLAAATLGPGLASARGITPATCRPGSTVSARVDLYFGAGRVTPRAWSAFLAGVVTPRFPEGFTTLEGSGQWRGPRGLARERTRVLVIFYRRDTTSDARIEAIRSAYRRAFAQVSVLRADSAACVGF